MNKLILIAGPVLLSLFFSAQVFAQEICTLGTGYPASGSKSIITQVAHHLEFGNEDSQKQVDYMQRYNKFYMTERSSRVEIIKRSGRLVQVRTVGKPEFFWTISTAVTCY